MNSSNMRIALPSLLITVWALLNPVLAQEIKFDCYSIIVGKDASADGSVLIGHNEDDWGEQIFNMHKVPAQEYSPGQSVVFKNGGVIEQVAQTNAFIWLQLPKMEVADAFITENGIVVASDGCPSREENPDLSDGGIVYYIRRLVAERAKTARHGVKLAGKLIEEFGYASSGRTYVIADKKEAWMLSAVHGKHWVAQRVPDDKVAVFPNYYTIGEINLADTTHFLGSADIIDYARAQGWYNPETDGAFHFDRAYTAKTSINHPGNTHRMLRGLNLLSGKKYTLEDEFPFAFYPQNKITIEDVKSVLRDHYIGTEFDKSQNASRGNPHSLNGSTICSEATQFSFVAQLRDIQPIEIGTLVWIAPFRPGVNAYTLWYPAVENTPPNFAYTDHKTAISEQFNPPKSIFTKNLDHDYWKYVEKVEKVDKNFKENLPAAQKKYRDLEKQISEEQKAIEKEAIHIYKTDPQKARQLLTDFSLKWAKEALNQDGGK